MWGETGRPTQGSENNVGITCGLGIGPEAGQVGGLSPAVGGC